MVNWCCRYYNYQETGFYYLQSRYYDPEICRFINADTFATTDVDSLLSTNMFSYCENNPISRNDPSGELFHVIAGAVIGAVVNCCVSYITHAAAGADYSAREVLSDALIGAASGALAATGLGIAGQAVGNAIIGGVSKGVELKCTSLSSKKKCAEVCKSALFGGLCGALGGDGLTKSLRVTKQIKIINTNIHCAFRPSAWKSIKASAKRISKDFFSCLGGFTEASFASNINSTLSGKR